MGKIAWLASYIGERINLLEEKLNELTAKELVEDEFMLHSVLHILQVSVQALIDLASHIISEAGLGIVDKYSSIPEILVKAGALSKDDAKLLRKIIGFRNVIVRCYAEVSKNLVAEILSKRKYKDLIRLAFILLKWAEEKGIDP